MAKDDLTGLPSGWLGRTLRTGALGGAVAARLAGGRLRRTLASGAAKEELARAEKEALAELLRDELGRMKGLAMKLGQMLSYMETSLPESARRILSELQDRSQPMAPRIVDEQIRRALGKPPGELFARWDPTPIGVASIGQVHRARLADGTEVAVKVQHPEIAEAFDSDFKTLGAVMGTVDKVFPSVNVAGIRDELVARLREECDYAQELESLEEFRELFAGDARLVFPRPIRALSTPHVLTTTFEDGLRFTDFVINATPEERSAAGAAIYETVYTGVWRHRIFNGDPHPGNYLFRRGPDGVRVVLLDFGCVKRWTPAFMEGQRRLVRAYLDPDLERFVQVAMAEGFVTRRDGFDAATFKRAGVAVAQPYLTEGLFRFTPEYVRWMAEQIVAAKDPFRTRMPSDMTLANRLWFGLYSVLGQLKAEIPCRAILMPLLYPGEAPPPVAPEMVLWRG